MLTRRHIRVKVLQSLYAMHQSDRPDLEKQEKFLVYSMEQMQQLQVLLLQMLVELRNQAESYLEKSKAKHLATQEEKNPSRAFVDNQLLTVLGESEALADYLKKHKLNYWKQDDEYVAILFKNLRKTDWYRDYLLEDEHNFKQDREFVVRVYKQIVAVDDKLYDYLEDKRLTWLDDYPLVNTSLVRALGKMNAQNIDELVVPAQYKSEDDKEFALSLLRKTILNDDKLTGIIDGKTPNWDKERIAEIDMLILKMGIAEFLYFPSIPVRATINEYLEIAKEYSTPKSSLFVNGILDKLVKDFTADGSLNKIGRGLQ
ncbi:transcription antitermination factor NusB [Aureitalea marina]|uniref:Transcription antitermination factor NusB n=1 Tax=Aureitalea marina TaxID=930804 RepID=A0A2S7KMR5_9FLAO|nr:transcription antitermination factor NusB [Aureitalea marina]PQB03919.1 transcription antitermination factor NusB [Aureitalea marina]